MGPQKQDRNCTQLHVAQTDKFLLVTIRNVFNTMRTVIHVSHAGALLLAVDKKSGYTAPAIIMVDNTRGHNTNVLIAWRSGHQQGLHMLNGASTYWK